MWVGVVLWVYSHTPFIPLGLAFPLSYPPRLQFVDRLLLPLYSYVILSGAQTLYAYLIEGDTVFVGKRKTYAKRVESERIRVDAKSISAQPSKAVSSTPSATNAPSYQLSMSYVRTTNSGKTVIHMGKERVEASYATFFDSEGRMDIAKFESWVSSAMGRVMGIRSEAPSS
ncbi:hypothetical protein FRB91_008580 [Serendipita sp. 411]|nr:hypothetical protein FRB91_008580 [Serendipita sp. 411]